MEKLQGSINSCLLEENLDVGRLEEDNAAALGLSYSQLLLNTHSSFRFDQDFYEEQAPDHGFSLPSVDDRMPFLGMLQSVESPLEQVEEPNFHDYLFILQQQQLYQQQMKKQQLVVVVPWENQHSCCNSYLTSTEHQQLESFGTNIDMMEFASPVKSELQIQLPDDDAAVAEKRITSTECNELGMTHHGYDHHHQNSKSKGHKFGMGMRSAQGNRSKNGAAQLPKLPPPPATRERKKRKRTRPSKNKEEVENQRMTHIAVERNRRRQMNDHLSALRSLMPPSYVQRGDQASIVGGAIDFVKELEQLLKSLEAQKIRTRQAEQNNVNVNLSGGGDSSAASSSISSSSSSSNNAEMPSDRLMVSSFSPTWDQDNGGGEAFQQVDGGDGGRRAESETGTSGRRGMGDVEAVMIQNHVKVTVEWPWERKGQKTGRLVEVIIAMEELRLTVLHLNITLFDCFVHYSFNLKIADGCNLGSAEEITAAVYQIFSLMNGS